MSDELVNLIAKKFIAQPDAKAIQIDSGHFVLHERRIDERIKERLPWSREDLEDHISGRRTFGHYLLNSKSQCKLFAFDVDLEKNRTDSRGNIIWTGYYPEPFTYDDSGKFTGRIVPFDPREAWLDRAHPSRRWVKYQLHVLARILVKTIEDELAIPACAAYSGAKGIHVYGFTGLIAGRDARDGAQIVLDAIGGLKPSKGTNFYRFANEDPIDSFPNFSIEVFPKQDSLEGKDLGNLMRLPLGRNKKSEDPTFFIDLTAALNDLLPADPIHALTSSPWARADDANRNGQLVGAR